MGTVSGYKRYGVDLIRVAKNGGKYRLLRRGTHNVKKKNLRHLQQLFLKARAFSLKPFLLMGIQAQVTTEGHGFINELVLIKSGTGVVMSYPLVLISKGPLPSPVNATAAKGNQDNIQFIWFNSSDTGTARKDDKVILLVYFLQHRLLSLALMRGTREVGTATLHTGITNGQTAETWMVS